MFMMMWMFIALFSLMPEAVKNAAAQHDSDVCRQSILVLQHAVATNISFFVRVHAAEDLIQHNHPAGLEAEFLQLQKAPDNVIGAARVLARLHKHHPKKYQQYLGQLLYQFEHGTTDKIRLTALESLGKLGYRNALPAIKQYADTGTGGFKSMACWILSNNETAAGENRLSALLLSADSMDYRYAAYALRFKATANAVTVSRLAHCLQHLEPDDAARVYVAACLFVHAKAVAKQQAKAILLRYATGTSGQRYEVAEALARAGSQTDVPVLQQLLKDENEDVQVAAANALLHIMHCKT